MKSCKKRLSVVREKITTAWGKSKPMVIKGVTIAGIFGTFIAAMNILSSHDNFENWLKTASDEELDDGYEKRRQQWMKDGYGDKTPEMEKINNEMNRRAAEKWEKDPKRNKDPHYRWTDANRWE